MPESVLASRLTRQASQIGPAEENFEIAIWVMIEDVRELSHAGWSDESIARELEIPLAAVISLRERYEIE